MKIADIQKPAGPESLTMNPTSLLRTAANARELPVKFGTLLQAPLLLVMRLWRGRSFFLTDFGKLKHHADTADFFQGLRMPLAGLNAWIAAGIACVVGLRLPAGFASRPMAIPLSIIMIVAYVTADNEALKSIFSEPDRLTSAAPFLFLLTAVLVLASGPGAFSVERLLARKFSPAGLKKEG